MVRRGFDLSELIRGQVEALTIMGYNELYLFKVEGYGRERLNLFRFTDLGLNFPEDGLYTHSRLWEEENEACRAFRAASLKGWRYANDHREETLRMILAHTPRSPFPTSPEHQSMMLSGALKLIDFSPQGLGRLSISDFDRVAQTLLDLDQIDTIPRAGEIYVGV